MSVCLNQGVKVVTSCIQPILSRFAIGVKSINAVHRLTFGSIPLNSYLVICADVQRSQTGKTFYPLFYVFFCGYSSGSFTSKF